jgi:hypothetical protein
LSDPQLWKQLKYELLAELEKAPRPKWVEITVHSQFKTYLQNNVRESLGSLAGKYGVGINIVGCNELHHESFKVVKHSESMLDEDAPPPAKGSPRAAKGLEKKLESAQTAHDNAP